MQKYKAYIISISIFIAFFLFFFFIHSRINGFFTTDDPYYHAKHAFLMAQSGDLSLVKPWLEFHFFKFAPVNAYWGYHLILALLIKLFGIFIGTKILASILSAMAFSVFYLILKDFKIKFALLYTFFYFASSCFFLLRLFSERPYIAGYTVLPLAFWLLCRKKYYWLFSLSLVYTIFYELSPLIIVLAGFYCLADLYLNKKINLKPIISTSSGVLAGILLHPNFLNYLYIIYINLFQVLYLKFTGTNLNVGAELNSITLDVFVNATLIGFVLYILALIVFFGTPDFKKHIKTPEIYFLFLYSIAWFIFSIFVPRGIDYWYPFAFLFIVFIIDHFLKSSELKILKSLIGAKINARILAFFIISFVFTLILYNFIYLYLQIDSRSHETIDRGFKEANQWLIKNTPEDSTVFYATWSLWPMMFFYNDHNHYIAGMDPTFLYEYDKKIYWIWKNISSSGEYCAEESCSSFIPGSNLKKIKHAFREIFGSDYIIFNNDNTWQLKKIIEADRQDYRKVFSNKELVIFRVLW
jgi:hypothetical protein